MVNPTLRNEPLSTDYGVTNNSSTHTLEDVSDKKGLETLSQAIENTKNNHIPSQFKLDYLVNRIANDIQNVVVVFDGIDESGNVAFKTSSEAFLKNISPEELQQLFAEGKYAFKDGDNIYYNPELHKEAHGRPIILKHNDGSTQYLTAKPLSKADFQLLLTAVNLAHTEYLNRDNILENKTNEKGIEPQKLSKHKWVVKHHEVHTSEKRKPAPLPKNEIKKEFMHEKAKLVEKRSLEIREEEQENEALSKLLEKDYKIIFHEYIQKFIQNQENLERSLTQSMFTVL